MSRTEFAFRCGEHSLTAVSEYTYLGLVINEFLDYGITAKAVAQSASRALGLIIAKCKIIGGVSYDVFTTLYESVVSPVVEYGAVIWGTKNYTCINAVKHRAGRFFLGVGKYSPNNVVMGNMGWFPIVLKQWKTVVAYWCRQ